tara:strand:- start:578 stop:910 length:333 start_codon:yes stop_codon:yes gene_type:complete
MDDNSLLMIILAFVVGYMCSGMMNSMCGGRFIEAYIPNVDIGEVVGDECGKEIPDLLSNLSKEDMNITGNIGITLCDYIKTNMNNNNDEMLCNMLKYHYPKIYNKVCANR